MGRILYCLLDIELGWLSLLLLKTGYCDCSQVLHVQPTNSEPDRTFHNFRAPTIPGLTFFWRQKNRHSSDSETPNSVTFGQATILEVRSFKPSCSQSETVQKLLSIGPVYYFIASRSGDGRFYLVQKRRATDFKAPKLRKDRSWAPLHFPKSSEQWIAVVAGTAFFVFAEQFIQSSMHTRKADKMSHLYGVVPEFH